MALIKFEEATLGYNKPVIGPLSFSVELEDRLGIWGPNGCGKSTLLRYFTDESRLFQGRISLQKNIKLAYQPQQPIKPNDIPINGHEYLKLMGAHSEGMPERLSACLDSRVDRLSGGQFQILSTWANLASHGELVLLDEPTNNLDPEAIELLADTILAMPQAHGLIIVSHERDFVEKVAKNIMVIDKHG
ncbi:MAG: ATP-binding cassette domain-containing protein [Pseudomonadales bacterium]|nr:ATP-binding cassette domain-containing protein [Pseudomonadales bacterium]